MIINNIRNMRPSVAQPTGTGGHAQYDATLDRLRTRHGAAFITPKTTLAQRVWFGNRVEVVSPCGFTRRGVISITTGWAPTLLLVHRRNQNGSWDTLNENDVIIGYVTKRGKLEDLPHDKLQVAVYQAQRGTMQ